MPDDAQHSWSHPKSIAVATDLNDLDYLLPQAKAQAASSGAALMLLHVIPAQVYASPKSGAYPFVNEERALRDAEELLAKITMQLQKEHVGCTYEIRRWFVAEEIRNFVREKKIDRLIIGTSGKGKLGKFLLGSVAEELIRTLEIPVCTIGPHATHQILADGQQILFSTSLHHDIEPSLQFARDFATASKSTLTILHVVESNKRFSQQELDGRLRLDYLLEHEDAGITQPEVLERYGDPAEEILREVSIQKPDVLILGAVPASNLTALTHTGVAYRVITKALCPVLTLRECPCTACKQRHSTHVEDVATAFSSYAKA